MSSLLYIVIILLKSKFKLLFSYLVSWNNDQLEEEEMKALSVENIAKVDAAHLLILTTL